MSRTEIIEKLKELLLSLDDENRERIENAAESDVLEDDYGFNSVNMLYLVISIEEAFDIRFDDVGFSDFRTLGDVVDYIERKLS